jgi:type II secretory pathway component PulJ
MLGWFRRHRMRRLLAMQSAAELLRKDRATAYYEATRADARARFAGDTEGFWQWSRVAAEVARLSDCPMDLDEVKRIVAEEEHRATLKDTRSAPR